MWLEKDRERRVLMWKSIKLAFAFILLNILDGILTSIAVANRGTVCELNPLMKVLLEQPIWIFWIIKISLALVFALLLLIFSNKYPRQVKRIFIILIGAMAGICLLNMMGLV